MFCTLHGTSMFAYTHHIFVILFLIIGYYYMLNPCLDPEENRNLFYMD